MGTVTNPGQITIFATGGTIDKFYSLTGSLDIGPPAAREILSRVLTDIDFNIIPLIGKDSMELTDTDRAELAAAIAGNANRRILITHGTDTMVETARYLAQQDILADRVIVLTGAMQPAGMTRSDAGFNMGSAVAALNLLSRGVYISMSGRIFPADTVAKDRERGIFIDRLDEGS